MTDRAQVEQALTTMLAAYPEAGDASQRARYVRSAADALAEFPLVVVEGLVDWIVEQQQVRHPQSYPPPPHGLLLAARDFQATASRVVDWLEGSR